MAAGFLDCLIGLDVDDAYWCLHMCVNASVLLVHVVGDHLNHTVALEAYP